jgi:acetyl esterase/lipase
LLKHAKAFAGELPLEDPRLSLIDAELGGLAPLYVLLGGAERLVDEGRELVQRAAQDGVPAELWVAADMPHNPPALAEFHPNAAEGFQKSCEFIARALSEQGS